MERRRPIVVHVIEGEGDPEDSDYEDVDSEEEEESDAAATAASRDGRGGAGSVRSDAAVAPVDARRSDASNEADNVGTESGRGRCRCENKKAMKAFDGTRGRKSGEIRETRPRR